MPHLKHKIAGESRSVALSYKLNEAWTDKSTKSHMGLFTLFFLVKSGFLVF